MDLNAYFFYCFVKYLFDFEEEISPTSIQNQQLLLKVQGHHVITCFNKKIPCIIHGSVLVYPVAEILKKLLGGRERDLYYKINTKAQRNKGRRTQREGCQNQL